MKITNDIKYRLPLSYGRGWDFEVCSRINFGVGCMLAALGVIVTGFVPKDTQWYVLPLVLMVFAFFFFVQPVTEWWERNHDGWVMIITQQVPPSMADLDPCPSHKRYYPTTYKRVSEFRHVPRRAYEDAILVAMNPKCLQVHFEDGHGVIDFHFLVHGDWGHIVTRGAGVKFTFSEPERLWKFLKENPFLSHLGSADDLVAFMGRQEGDKRALTDFLFTLDEKLADKKKFGRSAGALPLRCTILHKLVEVEENLKRKEVFRTALYDVNQELDALVVLKAAVGVQFDSSGAPEK